MKVIRVLLILSPLLLLSNIAHAADRVRPAVNAGPWYPAEPAALRKALDGYLAQAPKIDLGGPPVAIIVPHAGYRYSGRCAGAVYALLRGRDIHRVIVLAPSHHVSFRGGSIVDADFYDTPLGKIPIDRSACKALLEKPLMQSLPGADRDEHAIEVQLPFLEHVLGDFELIPIVLGDLWAEDPPKIAAALREYVDANTLIVASSDFTHYGRNYDFAPFKGDLRPQIEKLDKGAVDRILKLDAPGFRSYVIDTGATICGRNPISVLLELLTPDSRGQLVQYYLSGDEEKDYTRSVSYAGIAFAVGPGEVSTAGQKTLLDIARKTLRTTLAGQAPPVFDIRDPELKALRGAFVTYKNKGELRGCIGHFDADTPLWKTVQQMAVAAARDDYRFADNPITAKEEPTIRIEISILSPRVPVTDPLRFIPGVHGVYLQRGRMAGTYLPQVATEQGWDRRTFLPDLCRNKIGLAPDAWKDPATQVFIYSAQVFGED